MFYLKQTEMCYFAFFQGIEIAFEKDDIFQENKQIVVRNAKNCSDCKDKRLPSAIPINKLELDQAVKEEIQRIFRKKTKEKTDSKTRRKPQYLSRLNQLN
jgi:Na+-translocating ferredoxin:NAD+ oxidoreductase RnfC subunit